MRKAIVLLGLLALIGSLAAPPLALAAPAEKYRIFVFTSGAPQFAQQAAVKAIKDIGKAEGFGVQSNNDPGMFTAASLARFRAVVFLDTTGSPLNAAQEAAFEAYFHAGGGFLGIGSAIETEPAWGFLTELLGTRATGKTAVQSATVKVADRGHDATKNLPEYWNRTDAWYNFGSNVRGFSHVLATVVEDPFGPQPQGQVLDGIADGTMGADHPVAWCKDYKGGRSFYVAGGNTGASFNDSAFLSHLAGAIGWAAGVADPVYSDCGATVLANYQQVKVSSPPNLLEPIGFDQLPDGRIIQTARGGSVRLHNPASGTTQVIASIPVYTNSEDGLYGPGIDNDFATNHWVYLYYAPPTVEDVKWADGTLHTQTTPAGSAPTTAASLSAWDPWVGYFQLSRFKFVDGATPLLDLSSEQQILRVPNNRGACCHVAGDIDFDGANNLWFVTGDDSPAGGGNSGGFAPFNDMLTNESQTVLVQNATGGTFTLTFDGQTTGPIAFNAANADIEAALEALSNITDVAVTGTTTRTVNFRGDQQQRDVPQMTADATALTGTTPTVTTATTAAGGQFNAPFVDSRRSALNTNDLRGKINRITVKTGDITAAEKNTLGGAYTVPAGNLFPAGTAKTRPEVYAMGFRNPFRIQVDEDGVAYVSDYSPDSQTPQQFRGPAGTGRFEIVRHPANYGWPICYKTDLPYYRWDFNTSTPLDATPTPFDCAGGTIPNDSRWNVNGGPTVEPGLTSVPALTNPEVWYSYRDNNATSPLGTPCFGNYGPNALTDPPAPGSTTPCPRLFPELYTGGVGPHGIAKYHYDAANPNPTKFPPYYDNAVILGEFTQDTLRELRLDSQDRDFKINQFLNCGAVGTRPASSPFECDNPMDMQWGADGNFYLLTYGDGFFAANADAGMYKWEYVKGQRAPTAVLTATPTDGQEPLAVQFSSAGSNDADPGDSIRFDWDFDGNGTTDSIDSNPTFTYTTTGRYSARLTVTDSSGKTGFATTVITVGNTAPTVSVGIPVAGGTFAFGEDIPFTVSVSDPEDGAIDCSRVQVTFVLGHDTHGHAEDSTTGCSGVLHTDVGDVSHGGNVFGVISATYTDLGDGSVPALSTTDQHQIRQKHQEVENVINQSGTNTAPSTDVGGGLQRGSLSAGDWMELNGPFNLLNIDSITFRVTGGTNGAASGTVELWRDAINAGGGGSLVASQTITGTAAGTYASQTFPLVDPGGTHRLFLVFANPNTYSLNWIEFGGAGISVP